MGLIHRSSPEAAGCLNNQDKANLGDQNDDAYRPSEEVEECRRTLVGEGECHRRI